MIDGIVSSWCTYVVLFKDAYSITYLLNINVLVNDLFVC